MTSSELNNTTFKTTAKNTSTKKSVVINNSFNSDTLINKLSKELNNIQGKTRNTIFGNVPNLYNKEVNSQKSSIISNTNNKNCNLKNNTSYNDNYLSVFLKGSKNNQNMFNQLRHNKFDDNYNNKKKSYYNNNSKHANFNKNEDFLSNISDNSIKKKNSNNYNNNILETFQDKVYITTNSCENTNTNIDITHNFISVKKNKYFQSNNSIISLPYINKKIKYLTNNKILKNNLTKAERTAVHIRRLQYSKYQNMLLLISKKNKENNIIKIQRWWKNIIKKKISKLNLIIANLKGYIYRKKYYNILNLIDILLTNWLFIETFEKKIYFKKFVFLLILKNKYLKYFEYYSKSINTKKILFIQNYYRCKKILKHNLKVNKLAIILKNKFYQNLIKIFNNIKLKIDLNSCIISKKKLSKSYVLNILNKISYITKVYAFKNIAKFMLYKLILNNKFNKLILIFEFYFYYRKIFIKNLKNKYIYLKLQSFSNSIYELHNKYLEKVLIPKRLEKINNKILIINNFFKLLVNKYINYIKLFIEATKLSQKQKCTKNYNNKIKYSAFLMFSIRKNCFNNITNKKLNKFIYGKFKDMHNILQLIIKYLINKHSIYTFTNSMFNIFNKYKKRHKLEILNNLKHLSTNSKLYIYFCFLIVLRNIFDKKMYLINLKAFIKIKIYINNKLLLNTSNLIQQKIICFKDRYIKRLICIYTNTHIKKKLLFYFKIKWFNKTYLLEKSIRHTSSFIIPINNKIEFVKQKAKLMSDCIIKLNTIYNITKNSVIKSAFNNIKKPFIINSNNTFLIKKIINILNNNLKLYKDYFVFNLIKIVSLKKNSIMKIQRNMKFFILKKRFLKLKNMYIAKSLFDNFYRNIVLNSLLKSIYTYKLDRLKYNDICYNFLSFYYSNYSPKNMFNTITELLYNFRIKFIFINYRKKLFINCLLLLLDTTNKYSKINSKYMKKNLLHNYNTKIYTTKFVKKLKFNNTYRFCNNDNDYNLPNKSIDSKKYICVYLFCKILTTYINRYITNYHNKKLIKVFSQMNIKLKNTNLLNILCKGSYTYINKYKRCIFLPSLIYYSKKFNKFKNLKYLLRLTSYISKNQRFNVIIIILNNWIRYSKLRKFQTKIFLYILKITLIYYNTFFKYTFSIANENIYNYN